MQVKLSYYKQLLIGLVNLEKETPALFLHQNKNLWQA